MFSYTFPQWLLFFYIYCFIGWIIESTIVSFELKKFVNRGFLRSPFLPLYGFGAFVILFMSLPVKESPLLVYIFGMIGTTVLEYLIGFLMDSCLKMKYWDYSNQKFNYKGRICLTSSLFWGFLSLFLTFGLHKVVEKFVLGISASLTYIIIIVISVILVSDFVYAVRTALDVNKLLEKITNIKQELDQLKIQLAGKIENSERATNLRNRSQELKNELSGVYNKINFFNKELIKAHPNASSKNFNEALKELKLWLNEKKSNK